MTAEAQNKGGAIGPVLENVPEETDAVSVAPNWKLVWWRFRKHRLALVAGVLFAIIVLIAGFPGFFATQNPVDSDKLGSFMPPQGVHIWDDGPAFFAYAANGARNPRTLRMEWQLDLDEKVPLRFFGRGFEWKAFGLFPTTIHLIAPPSGRCCCAR